MICFYRTGQGRDLQKGSVLWSSHVLPVSPRVLYMNPLLKHGTIMVTIKSRVPPTQRMSSILCGKCWELRIGVALPPQYSVLRIVSGLDSCVRWLMPTRAQIPTTLSLSFNYFLGYQALTFFCLYSLTGETCSCGVLSLSEKV